MPSDSDADGTSSLISALGSILADVAASASASAYHWSSSSCLTLFAFFSSGGVGALLARLFAAVATAFVSVTGCSDGHRAEASWGCTGGARDELAVETAATSYMGEQS